MNKELKSRVDATLEIIPKEGKVLEIGSYPFTVTKYLISKGYDVKGIDKNYTRQSVGVVPCDIETEKFPFKNNTFDVVLMMEVFEHLGVNPIHALKEVRRVLKPKGIFVITTPNIIRLQNIKSILLEGKQLNTLKTLTQKESLGYMGHIREYTKKELKEILTYCKFKIEKGRMYEGSQNKLTKTLTSLFPSYSSTIMLACRKGDK